MRFEAWLDEEDGGLLVAQPAQVAEQRSKNLLSRAARLLHVINADTPEEAMAVHNVKMGWAPYQPMGTAADCPRGCGAKYYPEGSGICPNCGRVN